MVRERLNMFRETDIFEQDVYGSGDPDVDLSNAAHILQKFAESEGVDLDSLSDEDVADLVRDLMPTQETSHDESGKEASQMSEQQDQVEVPNAITYADVAVELAKIAAREGVDLTQISREEYHVAFDKVAQDMSRPDYFEEKVAEEEKLAAAYAQGRHMADGFLDRLKEAQDEDKGEKVEKKEDKEEKKEASWRDRAVSMARGAASKADKGVQRAGEKLLNRVGAGAEKASPGLKRGVGGGALAVGAGAVGTGAAGAAHAMKRKKESSDIEAEALKLAQAIAVEMGFDPSTGEKVAQDESDVIAARAIELLKEAGYPVE